MSLTGFLLARITEDEAVADNWPIDGPWGAHPDGGMWVDSRGHAIYGPRARVLAECEAKREILRLELRGYDIDPVIQELAAVYANHPDYDEAWRV